MRPDPTALARQLYAAFVSGNRAFAEALLADDFTFTSPYDDHLDKTRFFERCWPNRERVRALEVEVVAATGDDVFVRYVVETTDGARFRNVELLRFHAGRLVATEVYFGDPPAGIPRDAYADVLRVADRAYHQRA